MWSFEFLLGTTLLVVVVDHWLLHFRNREEIEKHRLFSLLIIGLTLFLYAKANEVLSVHGAARLLGWKFWSWTVIPVFCTSYFMKSYYGDRDFHRKWDYIAVGACLVYIVGIISCGWTNDVKLGLASLLLAIVYVPFEVHHYASTKQSKQLPSSVVPPNG